MLIVCEHCQRQLTLPDEKVPARVFALTCPGCKNRLQIDPANPPSPAPAPPPAVAPPPAAAPAEMPESASPLPPSPDAPTTADGFIALPPLHGIDKKLMGRLYPVGAVTNLTAQPSPWIDAGLKQLGIDEISHYEDLEMTAQGLEEVRTGVLVIQVDKASAPPFPVLEPLHKLPADVRRRTFVVLLADNVKSLDGMVSFFLQVNCLINSRERPRFPRYLQQALLFHLRHYRYWDAAAAD